jgi:hypothetical protein
MNLSSNLFPVFFHMPLLTHGTFFTNLLVTSPPPTYFAKGQQDLSTWAIILWVFTYIKSTNEYLFSNLEPSPFWLQPVIPAYCHFLNLSECTEHCSINQWSAQEQLHFNIFHCAHKFVRQLAHQHSYFTVQILRNICVSYL